METLKFILDNPDLFAKIINTIRICRTKLWCETETAEEIMKEIKRWQAEKFRVIQTQKQVLLFVKRIE